MRMRGLSLDVIPPIHIPLRFFLTAPWLGVAAALVLLAGGDPSFRSQWSSEMLAVTHLLTLGFMVMVMLGAMFQIVPVISGRVIPGGVVIATLVHLFLLVGTLLLVTGFYRQNYSLFAWAGPILALAFITFLLALGSLLIRRVGGGDSIFTIRFAALALLITVSLGLFRSANYAGLANSLELANITNLHLAWGLGGWVVLLVMGVSYQVIPMFHVTPNYPPLLARALSLVVFLSLLALTFLQQQVAQAMAVTGLCGGAAAYAIFTFHLISRRKRKVDEITIRFWWLSLGCLLIGALLSAGFYFFVDTVPASDVVRRVPVMIGVLMIYGFAISVIMGMVQKIVPFLSFLHLQRRCLGNFELLKTLPHMGNLISPLRLRWQLRLHVAALLVLMQSAVTGTFVWVAALLMAADFAWLGITLIKASWLYRETVLRINAE